MTNREMRWIYPNGANFAYDDLNRITQVEQGNAWQVFTRHHYQYDSVGREVATWRDEESLLGSGRGERFDYTPTNQLKKAWYQAQNVWTTAPQNAVKLQEYNYTPDMLNRSSVINNGIVEAYAATANGLNQYTGVGGLNLPYNDGNFNLTGFNGSTYVYGYTSQLISASKGGNSVQFTYDGLGRCVRRVVNGSARIFTYDGWKPILEWDGAGNWLALNIYGAGSDEILGRYDSIGRVLIYKHDKQGNVVALLGSDGSVVEKYSYDAFGKPTVTDNWGNVRADSIHENRFMFTGREWIKELGIYDYRNRFYHPGLGRFLQSDPTGFGAGDMNLFRYCGDDSVDNMDPTGLDYQWTGVTLVPNFDNGTYMRQRSFGFTDLTSFTVDAHVEPASGGWAISYRDVNIREHSFVRTQFRNSYSGSRMTPDIFQRYRRNIERTITHESIHGFLGEKYYNAHKEGYKQTFGNGYIYKSAGEASRDLEAKIKAARSAFETYKSEQHARDSSAFDGVGGTHPAFERSTDPPPAGLAPEPPDRLYDFQGGSAGISRPPIRSNGPL